MADIELSERAVERLQGLDAEPRERIKKKLEDIGDWPDHYLEPLSDSEAYKLRVGDYRVIIDWDREDDTLYVLTLCHRETPTPGTHFQKPSRPSATTFHYEYLSPVSVVVSCARS